MNILHIVSGYHKQKLYSELFDRLEALHISNMVYSHCEPGERILNPINNPNVRIYTHFTQLDRITYFGKQLKILRDLKKDFKIQQIDIVHAHTLFSCGYAAYRMKKKYRIPYVVAVRSVDVNFFFKKFVVLRGLGKRILQNAERIVFLNPSIREMVFERYLGKGSHSDLYQKTVIIPNGIDSIFLNNTFRRELAPSKHDLKLIMVAGINTNKNVEEVIEACKLMLENDMSVTFRIVGEIRDKKYKEIFPKYSFIDYHEKVEHQQVLNYMRESDIFVMPSHTESFGLAYVEAMSQGLPVIYTKGQGFDGQFEEGVVGYAVSDHEPREVVESIQRIMEDYRAISDRCVELVDAFDWEKISSQYSDIYHEISGCTL